MGNEVPSGIGKNTARAFQLFFFFSRRNVLQLEQPVGRERGGKKGKEEPLDPITALASDAANGKKKRVREGVKGFY